MKKNTIAGFLAGAMIFGAAGVFAGQYTATDNPFSVQLNGSNVSIEGYNINDSTYFKLRDIADAVGGFEVGFANNTIQLSKDGYVYDNSAPAHTNTITAADAEALAQEYYMHQKASFDPYGEYDSYTRFIAEDHGDYYLVYGTYGGNFEVDYSVYEINKATGVITQK